MLAGALAALDANREAEAITRLVEVWRGRRSPELADLIDLVDARLPDPPYAKLIEARADASIARLEAVATDDDPRLSTAVLAILAQPVFVARTPVFWRLIMRIAERLADPRLIDPAPGFATTLKARLMPAGLRDEIVDGLVALAGSIEPPRSPTAEEAALEQQLASRLARARTTRDREAELLDEIYADPTADGPRLVYADVLLERGDPHGELIALQFKRRDGGLTEPEAARERELLKKHIRTWLRGLAPVLAGAQRYSDTTFERGFVGVADLQVSCERRLPATWTERAWNTVELISGMAHLQRQIFERASLRGLRRIEHLAVDDFDVLEHDRFPHLDDIELVVRDLAASRKRLATFAAVPKLRRLALVMTEGYGLADIAWLLDTPLAARVERATFRCYTTHASQLRAARAAFDALVAQLATTPGPLRELALMPPWTAWPRPDPLVLARTDRGYAPENGV